MAIVITSTTSSQEQLDHATSENWREPFEEPAPKPVPTAEPEEELAETPAKEAEPEAKEKTERPKRKGGFQRTIERLRSENAQLQSRLAERAGGETQTAPQAVAQPQPTGEPKLQDYLNAGKTPEQWNTDHTRWVLAQDEAKAREDDQKARAEAQVTAYNRELAALEQRPDFDEVVEGVMENEVEFPQIDPAFFHRLGPQVVFWLAKNADKAREIAELDAEDAKVEIIKIAGRLEASSVRAKNNKARATPPPPITPVNGATTVNSVPPDEMKMKDFIKWREENGGRRR